MMKCPLYKRFDLVFGTSTGAIIAALIALGYEVDDIHTLYKEYVPRIMRVRTPEGKSKALEELATTVFADKKFDAVKTDVGIVTTQWVIEKPMIFKGNVGTGPRPCRNLSLLDSDAPSLTLYRHRVRRFRSLTERWSRL